VLRRPKYSKTEVVVPEEEEEEDEDLIYVVSSTVINCYSIVSELLHAHTRTHVHTRARDEDDRRKFALFTANSPETAQFNTKAAGDFLEKQKNHLQFAR
jgi:hypothetical protein